MVVLCATKTPCTLTVVLHLQGRNDDDANERCQFGASFSLSFPLCPFFLAGLWSPAPPPSFISCSSVLSLTSSRHLELI